MNPHRLFIATLFLLTSTSVWAQTNQMEDVASASALDAALAGHRYLVFTENRTNSIRRLDAIPRDWLARTETETHIFSGKAQPGEFYVFQIGVVAGAQALNALRVYFSVLHNELARNLPTNAVHCINLTGINSDGQPFRKIINVPARTVQPLWVAIDLPMDAAGHYVGSVIVQPTGCEPTKVKVELEVAGAALADHGDGESWRLSRLRWLDSTLLQDDHSVPEPYRSIIASNRTVRCLGRSLALDFLGLPEQIESRFSASNTNTNAPARQLLTGPVRFILETKRGPIDWQPVAFKLSQNQRDAATWRGLAREARFELQCDGRMEFDGTVRYRLALTATSDVDVEDVRLEVPYRHDAAKYWMGLGKQGGLRTGNLDWKWDIEKQQDCLWLGDVNIGAQWRFKGANYQRPLVNIYYPFHKLNLPESWGNAGNGGISVMETGNEVRLTARSGARTLKAGDTLNFDFDVYLTPFHPLETDKQWATRFIHGDDAPQMLAKAGKLGANVINIHHASDLNPFINYPYYDQTVSNLTAFIKEAHPKNVCVKVYYTTREITTHLPELWALHSLNGEIILPGPGNDAKTHIAPQGPAPWLREHLRQDYLPAWEAKLGGKFAGVRDPAVITTPDSRWNNFYLEGLDWLVKNAGIDGVYIDDTALDHHSLQRARKILDRAKAGCLIDLHSWNHFNKSAGFTSCANLYMEIFPYIDRLWFGEGFNYDRAPDYWLVEMSGIPYGLMGEMLQGGGNPWRGMLFGMTARLGHGGDPHYLWKFWDDFDMTGSEMVGWWDAACPVKTGRNDVLATVYRKPGKTLIALASWANTEQPVALKIDWAALGLHAGKSRLVAPAIEGYQPAGQFKIDEPIPVSPQRGWLLVLEPSL